jgi:HEAT repeat protein
MSEKEQSSFDVIKMLADYMEEGLLDNIVSMFKTDKTAYPLIGELITDERVRVRLGITALVEILAEEDPENLPLAGPALMKTLQHENPTYRGDAANLLGIMRYKEALPLLEELKNDEEKAVRQMAQEAIDDILRSD